jgi:hypothetical protein
MGLAKDHQFNVRWLSAAQMILKPGGTLWVTGTHHIIFSRGFALQCLGFRSIKVLRQPKGDCLSDHQTSVATTLVSARTVASNPTKPSLHSERLDARWINTCNVHASAAVMR